MSYGALSMHSDSPYTAEAHRVARRVFGAWNRDPSSGAAGSLDRPWWGWKFKDFSDATLQYGVRLACEYAGDLGRTAELPFLLSGYAACIERLQHADGSFDQCYPYERTPGVLYDFLSSLVYVARSGYLDASGKARLDSVMDRAVRFALTVDETHGEIANHIAQYAWELLNYADYADDDRARERGEAYLARALSLFDRDEGWFREYSGADAGYQTRCLRYIVKCAELRNDPELWEVARRAARFVWNLMMPDGSLHPMLGCRSTALLYPWAFERLSERFPADSGPASMVRQGWDSGCVPLPSTLDFANAVRLADDALDAGRVQERVGELDSPVLPDVGDLRLPRAQIFVQRRQRSVLYVAGGCGGAAVLYRLGDNGDWRLEWEDSGYMLDTGRERWLTRMPGGGSSIRIEGSLIEVRAPFCRSLHDELDPGRLVVLRLLNLTVLRIQWLADVFRVLVVRRLIASDAKLRTALVRTITVDGDKLEVNDRFELAEEAPAGRVFRCRRLVGGHMASARYFQEHELQSLPTPWVREVADSLSTAGPFALVLEPEKQ